MFSKTYISVRYNALIKSQPIYDEACSILLDGEFPESFLNEMTPLLLIKIESDDEVKKISFGKIDIINQSFQVEIINTKSKRKKLMNSLIKLTYIIRREDSS